VIFRKLFRGVFSSNSLENYVNGMSDMAMRQVLDESAYSSCHLDDPLGTALDRRHHH
jgi:hypothetical protein